MIMQRIIMSSENQIKPFLPFMLSNVSASILLSCQAEFKYLQSFYGSQE